VLVSHHHVQLRDLSLGIPVNFAESKPRWTPSVLDESVGPVGGEPIREVSELITIRQDGGKADDAPGSCVRPPKQPLNLCFVAHLPLAEPDHVAFVKDHQPHVIQERRVTPKGEIEFFGCRHHDVARLERVDIAIADTDAAIEARDAFAERAKRAA